MNDTRKVVLVAFILVLAGAIGVWWYFGFSLDFMRFFAAEITESQVSCSPATQTVKVNATATITATGGAGSYEWLAPESASAAQNGSQFDVSYASAGTKKVLVSSQRSLNGVNGPAVDIVACTVVVTK